MRMLYLLLQKLFTKFVLPYKLQRLKNKGMVVGDNFMVRHDVFIDSSHCWLIKIGNNVGLSHRVIILAHDASMRRFLNFTRIGKVIIGNRVFVGAGSIILPGVRIGNDVVIGAGSVVSRDIQDGSLVCGNPAKVIGTTVDYIERKKAEMKIRPCFSEKYTIDGGITPEMKAEMNSAMKDRIGYVP